MLIRGAAISSVDLTPAGCAFEQDKFSPHHTDKIKCTEGGDFIPLCVKKTIDWDVNHKTFKQINEYNMANQMCGLIGH